MNRTKHKPPFVALPAPQTAQNGGGPQATQASNTAAQQNTAPASNPTTNPAAKTKRASKTNQFGAHRITVMGEEFNRQARRMRSVLTKGITRGRFHLYVVSFLGLLIGHISCGVLNDNAPLALDNLMITIMVLLPLAIIHFLTTVEAPASTKASVVFLMALMSSYLTCNLNQHETNTLRREIAEMRSQNTQLLQAQMRRQDGEQVSKWRDANFDRSIFAK